MRWAFARLTLAVTLSVCAARAQDPVPSLDLRGFYPPSDPKGALYLEPATTPGPGNWDVGVWGSYARSPIVLNDASGAEIATVIEHQVSVDYFASLGIGKRLALALTVPTVVYQSGDDVGTLLERCPTTGPMTACEQADLPTTALGDIGFGLKATLSPPGELGGFGLAAVGMLFAPTGNPRSFVSDNSVRGELRVLGELQLLALAMRATAGARVRGSEQRLIDNGTDEFDFGHELPWGIGLTLRPQAFGIDQQGRWRWTVEARGAIALTPEFAAGPQSPALFGLSARYTVDEVSAIAGAELPLSDAVGVPLVRPVLGVAWSPRFEDEDGDLISDLDDECPELGEDRDGFEDDDGCPDFDNDDDGVSDDADRCPAEAEDQDGYEDDDGCLDPDNDGDGLLDGADACPLEAGPNAGPKPGCADGDADGVSGAADRCPAAAEDRDGFDDADGCPETDVDGDKIADEEDECPKEPGEPHPDTVYHGCPNPDPDGDTYDQGEDRCAAQAEDFDGIADDDGCADDESDKPVAQRGKPLVTVDERAAEPVLVLREPLKFEGAEVAPSSMPTLRAIAQTLNLHPSWVIAVGVKPAGNAPEAHQDALNRAFSVALALRTLTHRDAAAESLSWAAVKDLPSARKGNVGFLVFAPRAEPVPAPAPVSPPAGRRPQKSPAPAPGGKP